MFGAGLCAERGRDATERSLGFERSGGQPNSPKVVLVHALLDHVTRRAPALGRADLAHHECPRPPLSTVLPSRDGPKIMG